MTELFDSGWVSAPGDDSYIDIAHNLGHTPASIQLRGRLDDGQGGYSEGLPMVLDGNGDPVEPVRLEQYQDHNTVRVFKPAAYTFTGDVRIVIFE